MLEVWDIVEQLLHDWHLTISQEVIQHTHQATSVTQVYPEVYTIDAYGNVNKKVYMAQHHMERPRGWQPDVSFIIHHVIDAIKQRNDPSEDIDMALQLLEFDIATMTHHQMLPNIPSELMSSVYSDTRMKIAKLSSQFGKKLFQRFVDFGLYKNGYFPYHFAGWQDTCVLVQLDPTHR